MTALTTTWEIDEARFRARMERLGFDRDEIATHLAVVAGDAVDGRGAAAGVATLLPFLALLAAAAVVVALGADVLQVAMVAK